MKSRPCLPLGTCVFVGLLAAAAAAAGPGRAAAAVPAVVPVSPRHLVVTLDEHVAPSASAAPWSVRSADDPAYAAGAAPTAVAVKRRARALIPVGWPYPAENEYEVVLALPAPLLPGATYTVEWAAGAASWTLPFDPATVVTPALHHNQVGYLADVAERYAYVSWWLAALPPLDLAPAERSFAVVAEGNGERVLEGTLALRKRADEPGDDAYENNYALAHVWEADLSALRAPGRYHLLWDGVGRSETFVVAADAYVAPFRAAFRALYHQRCGTALTEPYTRWTHGACHLGPVERTRADYHVTGADAFGPLPAQSTGEIVRATGGYHDAGDYDRRSEHLAALDALVDLYELDPERFRFDDFDLPESGNRVPDVLDEARWAIGLYAALQQEDGGVPAGVETTAYPGWTTPPEDDTTTAWYAYAADPRSSYRFAGGAAKLARALGPFDAEAAAALLAQARSAWDWAEEHRAAVSYDSRPLAAYAAAELFKTTGEPAFAAAFRERGPFAEGDLAFRLEDWEGNDWLPALWATATADAAPEDLRAAATATIVARAESWLTWGGRSGFRLIKHPYAPVAFGSLTTPREVAVLVRAWALTGDETFRTWAALACDYTLGGNPYGRSWVTGLGVRRVQHPLHTPSLADDVAEPVEGLTVFGPWNKTTDNGIANVVLTAYDPPPGEWPLAERYVDVAYAPPLNEFTVHESIAPTLFAFGFLAVRPEEEPPPPADAGGPPPGVDAASGAPDAASGEPDAGGSGPDAGSSPGAPDAGGTVGPGGGGGAPDGGADALGGDGGRIVVTVQPPAPVIVVQDGGGCAAAAPGGAGGPVTGTALGLALLLGALALLRASADPSKTRPQHIMAASCTSAVRS